MTQGHVLDGSRQGRNALRGALIAYFVDMYDIYLPIVVLAPALGYFIPPGTSTSNTSLVGGGILATTLLGRPVGAAIFGHFADTLGRRRTTLVAVSGFGVCTLALALLPGYHRWGTGAIVVLLTLRFVDGVFLGGEYTAANPLAMESAPPRRRGVYSAVINSGFPLAYATASLLTLGLLHVMPSGGPDSDYTRWGWRIPFLIGAAMSLVLLAYYRSAVGESALWRQAPRNPTPIKDLFTGSDARGFAQVLLLMTGLWLSLQTVSAILPGVLGQTLHLTSTRITLVLTVTYLLLVPVSLGVGALSQRYGRRRCLIVLTAAGASAALAAYALLIAAHPRNLVVIGLLVVVTVTIVDVPFALMPAYINERFTLGVRGSGYGLAYSLSVVVPSLYSFYQLWLAHLMPARYTALPLLALGALLALAGATWGPETKDVMLGEPVPPGPAAAPAPLSADREPKARWGFRKAL